MTIPKDAEAELKVLRPRQRRIVLGGLDKKLGHYEKSGHLSYRYDICPVCRDVGSTEENPKCDDCYIKIACKVPFNQGFRYDNEKGYEYFSEMEQLLKREAITQQSVRLVVGGRFDEAGGKQSGVADKIAEALNAQTINGGNLSDLNVNLTGRKVILWMPDVDNEHDKAYPMKKDAGAVLICSKVMREGYTRFDSVSRIFKMGGNAVIEIRREDDRFAFSLIDALGNEWKTAADIGELAESIEDFVAWTNASIRVRTIRQDTIAPDVDLSGLVDLTRLVADRVENERGGRYFGNASTRCMKMFPSLREKSGFFVSARNVNKERITAEDFVYVWGKSPVYYSGDRKPSVDTPILCELYEAFPNINFTIHGHAFIGDAENTAHYYPCGDVREFDGVCESICKMGDNGIINLKGHGFLIWANSLEKLEELINDSSFINVVPLPSCGDK